MNILIIEDDRYLASQIGEVFEKNILTNRIKIVHSYLDFLDELSQVDSYDIILTDIILSNEPWKTGIDILKVIRKRNLKVPIVIISSLSSYESLENAFSVWANDYIIKPFRLRELEIRVSKWFHDYMFSMYFCLKKEISYQWLVYHISKSEFSFEWERIELTRSCKYLLSLFLIHPEELISERFLIEKIWWDYESFEWTKNPRINILRLKEKLKPLWLDTWIQNMRGEWYILRKD